MCATGYLSWLLMCIGGTPYVYSYIIILSTPTIAGVTKIAHRERVPYGALPKLGRVLIPLWKRTTPPSKKRRLRWRCASLFHQLLCHHENMLLPWVVLVWQTLYCKELLAKQDIIAHWYYWTRLLIKILHRGSHFAWLTLFVEISLFTGWCYSSSRLDATFTFLKSFCVHEHIQLSAASLFLKSHCAWTHIIWTWLLSKMSWRHSMCLAAYHNCSWSYIHAAPTWCDWTHKLEKCFNLKHCHFIKF